MTVPANTTYPPKATNEAWQSKKSFLDKAKAKTNKTGLGPLLTKAEAEWKLIRWHQLDAIQLHPANAAQAKANLKLAGGAFMGVQQTLIKINAAAVKANTLSTDKALSKTSQQAAKQIFTELNTAYRALQALNTHDFVQEVHRMEQADAAKAKYDSELTKVEFIAKGAVIATAPTATRNNSNWVIVHDVAWRIDGGRKHTLVNTKFQVKAQHGDGAAFVNDMTLTDIKGNEAIFKN